MQESPEKDVQKTVEHYLTGIQNPKTARKHLEQAFYSSTNLHFTDESGQLQFMPRDALVQHVVSGQVPELKATILTIEVTNNMAFAKVHLDLADRDFFDYLTLLKLDIGWRIVSKTYTTVIK